MTEAGASPVGRILAAITARGQTDIDTGSARKAVDGFVTRVLALTDEERVAVAETRKALDDSFREPALRAAAEALVGRAEAYVLARRELAGAHVPGGLDDDPARRDEVARLVRLAIDEALAARVGQDVLHPNHLRELHRPWQGLLR